MNLKNVKGMVLTEALVAVATLATATIILGSMITGGIDTTKTSKDYLVAQNLLTEGFEGVKNIRDSNHLIKPDKPECWLYAKPIELISNPNMNCAQDTVAEGLNYLILSENNQLQSVGGEKLNLKMKNQSNEKYRLHIDDLFGMVHNVNLSKPSKFYRSVSFSKIENGMATFEVSVQWEDGAKVKTVSDILTIFNYL